MIFAGRKKDCDGPFFFKNSKVVTQLHTDLRGRRNILDAREIRVGKYLYPRIMLSGNLYTTKIDKVSEKPTPLSEYAIRAPKILKSPAYL